MEETKESNVNIRPGINSSIEENQNFSEQKEQKNNCLKIILIFILLITIFISCYSIISLKNMSSNYSKLLVNYISKMEDLNTKQQIYIDKANLLEKIIQEKNNTHSQIENDYQNPKEKEIKNETEINNDNDKTEILQNTTKNEENENQDINNNGIKANNSTLPKDIKTEISKENIVYITHSFNKKYIYPTLVSMTSALESSSNSTYLIYYLLIGLDITEKDRLKFKTLEIVYPNKCQINFINMNNSFQDARQDYVPSPAYYRLILADIVTDIDKIIYMDGDTLVYEDLKEMYNLDMKNNFVLGFPDYESSRLYHIAHFQSKVPHYICSGVMLMNLKKLRENGMPKKFEKFVKEESNRLVQHDQTTINELCQDNIGYLPLKYGYLSFKDENDLKMYYSGVRDRVNYTELFEAYKNPSLEHLVNCYPKAWNKDSLIFPGGGRECHTHQKWYKYANKSIFSDEIYYYYYHYMNITEK